VSSRFGSLGHDHVAAGFGRHFGVLGGDGDDFQSGLVAHADHPLGHPQSGGKARCAAVADPPHLFDRVVVHRVQQVDAKRFVRETAHASQLVGDFIGAHVAGAEHSVTAGVADSRHHVSQ